MQLDTIFSLNIFHSVTSFFLPEGVIAVFFTQKKLTTFAVVCSSPCFELSCNSPRFGEVTSYDVELVFQFHHMFGGIDCELRVYISLYFAS